MRLPRPLLAISGVTALVAALLAPTSALAATTAVTPNYGTPTAATGKTCPFVGTVPVSINVGSTPYGSSLPGMGGVILPGPEFPSVIYGELCMTKQTLADAKRGRMPSVLVLVHGITYGTWYWDLPYEPERYSAVNYLIKRGYAVLNIDRLGDGRSGHPPSWLVTSATNADTVHQLIEKLRGGELGGLSFQHVGLVGHSYGTITTWRESAVYNDADLVIGTGYSDGVNPVTAGLFVSQARPASQDPRTADEPWAQDPGYLQPLPGVRGISQLYHRANADPAVIALDDKLANTVTGPELMTFTQSEFDGSRRNIRIPTFLINGEFDNMVCGNNSEQCATDADVNDGPAQLEKAAYRLQGWQGPVMSPQACFRSAVVPEAAHDINLHRNARQLYATIAYFADQAMGPRGENAESYRAACGPGDAPLTDLVPHANAPGLTPPPDLLTKP